VTTVQETKIVRRIITKDYIARKCSARSDGLCVRFVRRLLSLNDVDQLELSAGV
jgi:hypothetical protein